jgi:hypothetical protein
MPSVKSTDSTQPWCLMRNNLANLLARSEIPARFITGADPNDVLAQHGIKPPFRSKNRIFCISGSPESGKTTVMTAMLMRGILRLASKAGCTGHRRRYLYLDAARTFRTMRKLSVDEDLEHPAYWVSRLALDDLDKVEMQYRGLVRDVIVHREQNALLTLVSLRDAKIIRECGDQVYRRIAAGTQLPLRNRRISANSGSEVSAPPARAAEVKAPTLPGMELSE